MLEGGADLVGEEPLALSVRGDADLRALTSPVAPPARPRNGATGPERSRAPGPSRAWKEALLSKARACACAASPTAWRTCRERSASRRRRRTSPTSAGTLAGGTLEVGGQVNYAGGRLVSYDIPVLGRGLGLRYPEGLRSLVDADLRLFGDAERQWVTGTIDVKQAVWSKRYDVASELLARRPALAVAPPRSRRGRGSTSSSAPRGRSSIDNNLADLQARADLAIQGTSTAPVVTGRAEVDRGRIYFQGRTYVIRQGTLDFVNPQKLDPLFDIEAETRIRSYRVTLRVGGTLERVTPTLTSDPPLSSVQILALLAGGDETGGGRTSPRPRPRPTRGSSRPPEPPPSPRAGSRRRSASSAARSGSWG